MATYGALSWSMNKDTAKFLVILEEKLEEERLGELK